MISWKSSCLVVVVSQLRSCVLITIMRGLTIVNDIVNVPNSNLHVISVSVNGITKCSLCVTIISVILSVILSIGLCSINSLRPFVIIDSQFIINCVIIVIISMAASFESSTRRNRLSPCDYDGDVVHMIRLSPCGN